MAMTTVKEKGIPFKGEMVRAILEGRKTQTRRAARTYESRYSSTGHLIRLGRGRSIETDERAIPYCPYGSIGDRLWVKETLREDLGCAVYAADMIPVFTDGDATEWRWRRRVLPSIHMPRWASRITLEITDVRVERLQGISEEDAWDEGFPDPDGANRNYPDRARYWFKTLWGSINGPGSWDANSFVWAISFRPVEAH